MVQGIEGHRIQIKKSQEIPTVDQVNWKGEYQTIVRDLAQVRPGVAELEDFLWKTTNISWAPASCRYHHSEEQGYLRHAVGVVRMALQLQRLMPRLEAVSVILSGIYHDCAKLTDGSGHDHYQRIPLNEGNGKGIKWKVNPNEIAMAEGVRSVLLVQRFVKLRQEEAQAICYHNGPYLSDYRESLRLNAHPLTVLIHSADLLDGIIFEKGEPDSTEWWMGEVAHVR